MDFVKSQAGIRVISLRYFNPVGAHPSGKIGELPIGTPANLVPFVTQTAAGIREKLTVFGDDYDTPDGTCVRDYIHVMDLSEGHLAALQTLQREGGLITTNLGTGQGYSVLEMVAAFAKASGRAVPYKITARRPGDVAQCYADPSHARRTLNWQARRDLDAMCIDHWRWQSQNPRGF